MKFEDFKANKKSCAIEPNPMRLSQIIEFTEM